jgi:hypothetical protein
LNDNFAIKLWHLTKRGAGVIIVRDDIRPVEVANPHLFESNHTPPAPKWRPPGKHVTEVIPATSSPDKANADQPARWAQNTTAETMADLNIAMPTIYVELC